MKFHSFVDVVTNSSTVIFVNASTAKPIKDFIEQIGAEVEDVVLEDCPDWLDSIRDEYEDDYWDMDTDAISKDAPPFDEWKEKHRENYFGFNEDKTIVVILKDGTRIDMKHVFEHAFEIDGCRDG
jgi:hypothetical protein